MSDTLVAFLLARIAEDERVVPTPDFERKSTSRAWYSTDFDVVFVEQDRWLAECAAKRELIQMAQRWIYTGHPTMGWVFRVLAKPYADHPDFPREWMPEA